MHVSKNRLQYVMYCRMYTLWFDLEVDNTRATLSGSAEKLQVFSIPVQAFLLCLLCAVTLHGLLTHIQMYRKIHTPKDTYTQSQLLA